MSHTLPRILTVTALGLSFALISPIQVQETTADDSTAEIHAAKRRLRSVSSTRPIRLSPRTLCRAGAHEDDYTAV